MSDPKAAASNSSLLSNLARVSSCVNQACTLSHKLVELDRNNFGKNYETRGTPTNIFPRICNNCLKSKFGLFEHYSAEAKNSNLNCIIEQTQGADPAGEKEGPYLRAVKPVSNVVAESDVVFPRDTIIFPSGVLMVDLFMGDENTLFNKRKSVPSVTINGYEFRMNPYIYAYLKHLHDRYTLPSTTKAIDDANSRRSRSFDSFEDFLCSKATLAPEVCLSASYEVDVLSIGNLVQPLSSTSKYVLEGRTTDSPERLSFSMQYRESLDKIAPPKSSESPELEYSWYVAISHADDAAFRNSHCVHESKIQLLNSVLFSDVIGMKQLIVNRQHGLLTYFMKSTKKPCLHHRENTLDAIKMNMDDFARNKVEMDALQRRKKEILSTVEEKQQVIDEIAELRKRMDENLQERGKLSGSEIVLVDPPANDTPVHMDDPCEHMFNVYSAIGLHVASFCVPAEVYTADRSTIYRKYLSNVRWIEGVGLVSTTDICQKELLVINEAVSSDTLIALKMNTRSYGISYEVSDRLDPSFLEEKPKQRLNYDWERRRGNVPKICLYGNL